MGIGGDEECEDKFKIIKTYSSDVLVFMNFKVKKSGEEILATIMRIFQ